MSTYLIFFFFFFSSRRRHTRSLRDWSSDVCSSDLEAQGAKSDAKRKLRESSDRECKQIRDRAGKEIDRLDEVWSRFKNLKVQDLEGDELLYREMRDRFGRYFRGGMGAQAIQDRLACAPMPPRKYRPNRSR